MKKTWDKLNRLKDREKREGNSRSKVTIASFKVSTNRPPSNHSPWHAYSVSCPQRGSASFNELAPWLDQQLEPAVLGRSEADKFNSGNSCWSYSRIRRIHPVSRGRALTGNSNLPIRTKSRVDGANGKASRIWTTTNYHERSGKNEYILYII